ncbi:hypothetical protein ILYODFUR_000412 [Ilyodon furcidens]|uniref:Uncharacterized protein n=1 Tax=Ilyodon furcidens TaxID=33524 RepID=A0ABV0TF77_9TELE
MALSFHIIKDSRASLGPRLPPPPLPPHDVVRQRACFLVNPWQLPQGFALDLKVVHLENEDRLDLTSPEADGPVVLVPALSLLMANWGLGVGSCLSMCPNSFSYASKTPPMNNIFD